MASTINASTSSGIVQTADTSGVLQLQTNGTPTVTVDTSGNLGLGVTPSATSATGYRALEIGTNAGSGITAGNGDLYINENAYVNGGAWKYAASSVASAQYNISSGVHKWTIAGSGTVGGTITWTQAMTLNNSSQLYVNCTSAPTGTSGGQINVQPLSSQNGVAIGPVAAGNTGIDVNVTSTSGFIGYFRYGGALVGTINTNGTTTAYNTSSDYRLKNTIVPMTGALAKVAQLKPVTYKWNSDNSDGEGFIAHELAEVCPHAVTGTKDAVDEEGNPVYQGIDVSFLVATLTSAIQELSAQVTELKAEVQALKGA